MGGFLFLISCFSAFAVLSAFSRQLHFLLVFTRPRIIFCFPAFFCSCVFCSSAFLLFCSSAFRILLSCVFRPLLFLLFVLMPFFCVLSVFLLYLIIYTASTRKLILGAFWSNYGLFLRLLLSRPSAFRRLLQDGQHCYRIPGREIVALPATPGFSAFPFFCFLLPCTPRTVFFRHIKKQPVTS